MSFVKMPQEDYVAMCNKLRAMLNEEQDYTSKDFIEKMDSITVNVEASGDNPNYVETITGTLANPRGDSAYTFAELFELQSNNAITLMIDIDASLIGAGSFRVDLYTSREVSTDYGYVYRLYADGVSETGPDVNDWTVFVYSLVSPGPDTALLLDNGVVTDLSEYLGLIPTVLTIIHHPLPDTP